MEGQIKIKTQEIRIGWTLEVWDYNAKKWKKIIGDCENEVRLR